MSVTYLDLSDFLAIAAAVTGQDAESLVLTSRLDLADSALNAPSASFGGTEFYPDFVDKAAVLLVRIAKNHPLMDGNKRAAWTSLRMFLELNGWSWEPYPSVDEAEHAVLCVASGEWAEEQAAAWLRGMIHPHA